MKQIVLIMAALLAGFVGGVLGTHVTRTREQACPEQLVRARSFELVDETGKAISYWGIDKEQNAVLAFASHWPPGAPGGGGRHSPIDLADPHNQRAAFGVLADSPFLDLRGVDGETRMRLNLSIYAKPILWMADETGKRLSLGVEHSDTPGPQDNNWALDFAPDRARIGMFTVKEEGQTFVKGLFDVNRDKVKYPYQQQK